MQIDKTNPIDNSRNRLQFIYILTLGNNFTSNNPILHCCTRMDHYKCYKALLTTLTSVSNISKDQVEQND